VPWLTSVNAGRINERLPPVALVSFKRLLGGGL
jgi:hypothetical protein